MKLFSMTEADMTEYANNAVDNFLNGLVNAKAITEEQFTEYSQYRITLVRPTMWGRLWKFLKPSSDEPDSLCYYLVKPIGTARIEVKGKHD